MSVIKYYAIIVGGGSGSRMQSDTPKQFLPLKGRPVLMHTIEAFHSCDFTPEIIVVLDADFHSYWQKLCAEYAFTIPHKVVSGGEHRFHSVQNGIKHISDPAIVAIHDAVRPCISRKIIHSAFKQAEETGTAVTAIKSRDSIRQLTQLVSVSLNREEIYIIQTPQVFKSEILRKAYEQEYQKDFTDDATVVERSGVEIKLVEGDFKNLKITYPEDMFVAEMYVDCKN